MKFYLYIIGRVLISSCQTSESDCATCETKEYPSGKYGWISGSDSVKFDIIANQLSGFDVAMAETGYRYQELYWAGQDENWEYADYQLKKIKLAIENGLERRPKRAESAQFFLDESISSMQNAIDSHDSSAFNPAFILFTKACNNCHAMEQVSFFNVQPPLGRNSPIRK